MGNPPPGWFGSASSRSLLKRIEKSRVTPFSCMVAPKIASAAVQRGVELVEHAQRRGLHHVDGEEQRDGGHGALAAGEQGDSPELGTRGLRDNLDTALQWVFSLDHREVSGTAFEEPREGEREVLAHLFKRIGEELERGLVEFLDRLGEFFLRLPEVVALLSEEVVAVPQGGILLDGDEVHGAHASHAFT